VINLEKIEFMLNQNKFQSCGSALIKVIKVSL